MKFKFNQITCSQCHQDYDQAMESCPHCHHINNHRDNIALDNEIFWVSPAKQGLLFAIGFFLFHIVGYIASLIIQVIGKSITNNKDELLAFLSNPKQEILLNFICYLCIFVGILIVIYPCLHDLFAKFKKGKTWLYGCAGGIALILFTILYGMIISLIVDTDANENQQHIESIIKYYPVASLFLFGIVGPLCEEFTYRIGVFSFLARFNKVIAYLGTGLIFGLIHFSFSSIGQPNFIQEIAMLPNYIGAGLILCFIYQKSSWAGSSIAHIINNVYATIISIIAYNIV